MEIQRTSRDVPGEYIASTDECLARRVKIKEAQCRHRFIDPVVERGTDRGENDVTLIYNSIPRPTVSIFYSRSFPFGKN